LGDVRTASNGAVEGFSGLARFGRAVSLRTEHRALRSRVEPKNVNVTPNHHELAARWAFSDNFYADPEMGAGKLANALRSHLERHGVTQFHSSDEVPQLIAGLERRYGAGGEPFPRFLYLRPTSSEGYLFEAPHVAEEDYALGRIVEYLSGKPWWRETAIFIAGDGPHYGPDHVDSHRALLFAVSPYAKKNYVSHANTSFPGLIKTALRILRAPPLDLSSATATGLADCFTREPDFTPFRALPRDARVFGPETRR
jgi:hypothetical protein